MVVLEYSSVQHCLKVVSMAAGNDGEGIFEQGNVHEENVDEEVSYEETDFLDGSSSS